MILDKLISTIINACVKDIRLVRSDQQEPRVTVTIHTDSDRQTLTVELSEMEAWNLYRQLRRALEGRFDDDSGLLRLSPSLR